MAHAPPVEPQRCRALSFLIKSRLSFIARPPVYPAPVQLLPRAARARWERARGNPNICRGRKVSCGTSRTAYFSLWTETCPRIQARVLRSGHLLPPKRPIHAVPFAGFPTLQHNAVGTGRRPQPTRAHTTSKHPNSPTNRRAAGICVPRIFGPRTAPSAGAPRARLGLSRHTGGPGPRPRGHRSSDRRRNSCRLHPPEVTWGDFKAVPQR